jgi:ribosomal protein L1
MSKHGKRYTELLASVDREREYEPAEAVALVKSLARTRFDESVEVHVRTGLNVRHADEQLRGTIALPNGLGKDVKVEYRTDRTAIVHLVIGKASFDDGKLLENYAAVIEELIRAKPSVAKGRYLRSITIATTMSPGVKVDPSKTRDIVGEAPSASIAA